MYIMKIKIVKNLIATGSCVMCATCYTAAIYKAITDINDEKEQSILPFF